MMDAIYEKLRQLQVFTQRSADDGWRAAIVATERLRVAMTTLERVKQLPGEWREIAAVPGSEELEVANHFLINCADDLEDALKDLRGDQ